MSRIENTGANLNQGQKTELLRRWFTESEKSNEPNAEKHHWEEDKPVAEWLEKQIKASIFLFTSSKLELFCCSCKIVKSVWVFLKYFELFLRKDQSNLNKSNAQKFVKNCRYGRPITG